MLGDVLEHDRAKIADRELQPRAHLPISVFGETDAAGHGDALEARGDIDAVAHEIAVALLNDVPDMNADAELDPPVLRHARVALNHAALHFDRAAHGVDHAAELDQGAVAGALHHPACMDGDRRVDQIAAQGPKARQRAVLVRAGKPREPDDVGGQNRGELAKSLS